MPTTTPNANAATPKMSVEQFGATVKQKYPAYAGKEDFQVGQAMLRKYPQYASRISTSPQDATQPDQGQTDTPPAQPSFFQKLLGGANKAISATSGPAGIASMAVKPLASFLGPKVAPVVNSYLDTTDKVASTVGTNVGEEFKGAADKITESIQRGAEGMQKASQMPGAGYQSPGSPESRQPITPEERAAGLEGVKNVGETGLGSASGFVQGVFAPISGIIKSISDAASDQKSVQQFAQGTGPILDLYQSLESKLGEIAKEHPEAARNIGDAANVLLASIGGEEPSAKKALTTDVKDVPSILKDNVSNAPVTAAIKQSGKTLSDLFGTKAKNATATEGAAAAPANAEVAAPQGSAIGRGMRNTTKSIIANTYGLDPETQAFLMKNPHLATPEVLNNVSLTNLTEKVRDAITKEKGAVSTPDDIASVVRDSLQKKVQALNEHAKQYSMDESQASGAMKKGVKVAPDWLKKQLTNNNVAGVEIDKEGNVTHGGADARINPADSPEGARRMQDLWDTWGPKFAKGVMSRADFLRFRQSLAGIADYKGGVDTALKQAAHTIRDNFNKEFRTQVPGLADLDKTHAAMEKDLEDSMTGIGTLDKTSGKPVVTMNEGAAGNMMNAIKDTKGELARRLESIAPGVTKRIKAAKDFTEKWSSIVDEQGRLRENSLNEIKNSINAHRDLRLQKLEELMPGISEQLRLIKAAEGFHAASTKAGIYGRSGLATAGALAGNAAVPILGAIPGYIGGLYAASPEVGLKLLRVLSKFGASQ